MAIFNSYVKLPEGTYKVDSKKNRPRPGGPHNLLQQTWWFQLMFFSGEIQLTYQHNWCLNGNHRNTAVNSRVGNDGDIATNKSNIKGKVYLP